MAKNKKIIREVSTIARLHHRYIVRYFQAWIETGGSTTESSKTPRAGGRGGAGGQRAKSKPRAKAGGAGGDGGDDEDGGDDDGADWLKPSASTFGGGEDEEEGEEEDEDGSGSGEDDDEADSEEESGSADPKAGGGGSGSGSGSGGGVTQFLYIQMEYCPNKTLRDLIDEKVMANPDAVWRLFRQTLEAIAEIHRKG